jgi:hypothetical protein
MKYLSVLLLLSVSLIFISCDDDGGGPASCDPLDANSCEEGQLCVATGPDESLCVDSCDPMATESECSDGNVCIHTGGGLYGCVAGCTVGEEECGDGWICLADGDLSICKEVCDLGGDQCGEDMVCVPVENGSAVCMAQCDPDDRNSCGETRACELNVDGNYACYLPVFIEGIVMDSADLEPIESAHVMAMDKTGASASNVAVTDVLGAYSLRVPVTRDGSGIPVEGMFTLRASAQDYEKFPHGIRPSLPIDGTLGASFDRGWVVQNPSTDIALILLPSDMQGLGSVSGQVVVDASSIVTPAGVLIVLEEESALSAPMGFSDLDGYFTVFNVPQGEWLTKGYKAFLQLVPVDLSLGNGDSAEDVRLVQSATELGTVSGSINIVNPGDGDFTTVVLVPTSTFSDTFGKGEVPTGLRSPPPPGLPDVSGSFTIEGVPDGEYVVLAAFENDFLVRDPDPNIAGTETVYITVPLDESYDITIDESFKVTGALGIMYPGAQGPESVEEPLTFIFEDDSSEENYLVIVFNAFGEEVWRNENVPSPGGGEDVEVLYEGPALVSGMYYQFRAWSMKDNAPISTTEDLLGVFFIAPIVN